MPEEPAYPLPKIADRTQAADRPLSRAERPEPKPFVNSPVMRQGTPAEELVRLIDGQIVARLAEVDELTRIRRIILKGSQMSGG